MISVFLGITVMIIRIVGIVKGICLRYYKYYSLFIPEVFFF
jgi:hypothetical protein